MTRRLVSSGIDCPGASLSTTLTVVRETPAARATSVLVILLAGRVMNPHVEVLGAGHLILDG
ncbi:hypothetical protein GCM10009734_65840 [Nonomuraea bangladeshensis]